MGLRSSAAVGITATTQHSSSPFNMLLLELKRSISFRSLLVSLRQFQPVRAARGGLETTFARETAHGEPPDSKQERFKKFRPAREPQHRPPRQQERPAEHDRYAFRS